MKPAKRAPLRPVSGNLVRKRDSEPLGKHRASTVFKSLLRASETDEKPWMSTTNNALEEEQRRKKLIQQAKEKSRKRAEQSRSRSELATQRSREAQIPVKRPRLDRSKPIWRRGTTAQPVDDKEAKAGGDVDSLRQEVELLKRQLEAAGQKPVKAVSLAEARERLRDAIDRFLQGDNTAQKDVDEWDRVVKMHPEYEIEQQQKKELWMQREGPLWQAAVSETRSFVPPDIFQTTFNDLRNVMSKPLAQRIWQKRALWLVRMHVDDIRRLHLGDLRTKYTAHGMDLTELRAFVAVLPSFFDNDGNGQKQQWLEDVREKLRETVAREQQGTLPAKELRCPVYEGAVGLYDTLKEPERLTVVRSRAFESVEAPQVVQSVRDIQNQIFKECNVSKCISSPQAVSAEDPEDLQAAPESGNRDMLLKGAGENAGYRGSFLDELRKKQLEMCKIGDERETFQESIKEEVQLSNTDDLDEEMQGAARDVTMSGNESLETPSSETATNDCRM